MNRQNWSWRIYYFFQNVLIGDRHWANIRFFATLFLALLYIFFVGNYLARDISQSVVIEWKANAHWLGRLPNLPGRMAAVLFDRRSLVYLLIPFLVSLGVLLAAARYIQDVYELEKFRHAWRYLIAAMFGFGYPKMKIVGGKPEQKNADSNLLQTIGGPGFITVLPGNEVVFERINGVSNISGQVRNFVSRFEKVKEVFSLEEQSGEIEELRTTTKDGIPVVVQGIQFRYRFRNHPRYRPDVGNQGMIYRVVETDILRASYNRPVYRGEMVSLKDLVKNIAQSVLVDYISRHTVDQLTAPVNDIIGMNIDPRAEIDAAIVSGECRTRFRQYGIELTWFATGHFVIPNAEIARQRLETWSAVWQGNSESIIAEGRSRRERDESLGRTEAQAAMINGILEAIGQIAPQGTSQNRLKKLILLQTAQIVDAMLGDGGSGEPSS